MTNYQRELRSRVRRIEGLLHLALDDRDVVLDGVAEFLWHQLARRTTVEALIEAVASEYGVSEADVSADVTEVIHNLVATGFVREWSLR